MTKHPTHKGGKSRGMMGYMAERGWYAVRCVFEYGEGQPHTYEERVTLWLAGSAEEAIDRAESEAVEFAEPTGTYLGLAQSFHLFSGLEDGVEVFSLMRDSDLGPDEYISRFFASGRERLRNYGA